MATKFRSSIPKIRQFTYRETPIKSSEFAGSHFETGDKRRRNGFIALMDCTHPAGNNKGVWITASKRVRRALPLTSDFIFLKELTAKSPSDQHLRQTAAVFTAFPINPESQLKASADPSA